MPNLDPTPSDNSAAITTVYQQSQKPKSATAKPKPKPQAPAKKTASGSRSSGGQSAGGGGWTAARFARELLRALGAPVTSDNVRAIVSWEAAEGGHWENSARFNPINTTQAMPGDAGSMNTVGVRVFTSWKQGVAATVKTLQNGNYGSILSALQNGNDAGQVLNAVVASPWSTYGNGIALVGSAKSYGTGAGQAGASSGAGTGAGGGAGAGGGNGFGTPKPMTVQQYLDDPAVQADYGYLTAFLHNPAIGPVLAKAAKEGWGANQLLGAFNNKKEFPAAYKWWHQTAATARAWQAQKRLDPATAQQRLNQMAHQVQTLAQSTLGYRLDDQRLTQLANHAIAFNWSQQDLQHAVGAEFHYNAKQQAYKGAAGQTLDQFKALSRAYLVPISDHTLNQWTRGVLEGTYQPKDFESYVKSQAHSLYPTLKAALDSGQTVSDYLNPYAQLAGQTLNMDPSAIDWFNPKWSKALNTTTPDGGRAPMSLSDWSTYLRGLPDYQQTPDAKAQAASFGLTLAQTFGKVAV